MSAPRERLGRLAATTLILSHFLGGRAAFGQPAPASDWVVTGADCAHFAVGDVNADGFGDVLTINGSRQLCAALCVQGWKASGWLVLAEPFDPGELALIAGDFDPAAPGDEAAVLYPDVAVVRSTYQGEKLTTSRLVAAPEGVTFAGPAAEHGPDALRDATGAVWRLGPTGFEQASEARGPTTAVAPPPYEPEAPALAVVSGDVTGDGLADAFGLFECSRPHPHRVLRMAPGLNTASGDTDSDGLADEEEARLGADPRSRDTDADGLLDGWEVHGLPRAVRGPETALSPVRQDVIVAVAPYAQLGTAAVRSEIEKAKRLYAQLSTPNPDGSTGITLHLRFDPEVPEAEQGSWSWWEVGNARLEPGARGLMHWMQVTPGGGGQAQETGDMGGCGNHWAAFAHELGHQLSLSHTGDSAPAWCPLYPSLMSYAFTYQFGGDGNAIRFSDGRFASLELREDALPERLPFPASELSYLAAGPFRFPVSDDGSGGALIDWNQNGRIDEQPVTADVNYGGSTNAGIRRWTDLIGAAPALGYVGGTCLLVTLDQTRSAISVRSYEGGEKWSEARAIRDSAAIDDPVLVAGPEWGYVFFRQQSGWYAARVNGAEAQAPVFLGDLPRCDLSGAWLGSRVLLVSRHSDDRLETRWLEWGEAPALKPGQALETRSQVPPGLAVHPSDGRICMVTSMPNSHGAQMCMRVTWLTAQGERVREGETLWTRGEPSGNSCVTRPAVAFTPTGELNIFHTAWPGPSGLMTAWRTRRVENTALDEGWLTAMMYDEWTLTRVGVTCAIGAQGAIYAFRWDAGEHGEVHVNHLGLCHNALGIDPEPMRDFDDGAKISQWGIRHSILWMSRDRAPAAAP
ncbi:MAG TPA: hypothetical protein VFF69_07290 [Phycisphaerales bacterium]|nr:hypothetical protein [Phycisphaerales bacterium]